jgi:hypothetical protein
MQQIVNREDDFVARDGKVFASYFIQRIVRGFKFVRSITGFWGMKCF